jgi:hypothetical protein
MQAVVRTPDSSSDLLQGHEFFDVYSSYTQNNRSEHESRCGTGSKPIEVRDAEAKSEEPEFPEPSFQGHEVVGSAMEIEQIPFASGSISLGMAWMPGIYE